MSWCGKIAGGDWYRGGEIRDPERTKSLGERRAAYAAESWMGQPRVTIGTRGRDLNRDMSRAVLVMRIGRLCRGCARRMRRHEQIMPNQREDDEESLDPE